MPVVSQSHPLGLGGSVPGVSVRGHSFGLSRASDFKADGVFVFGHGVPFGRVVVASSYYNSLSASGQHEECLSISLPDVSGDFTLGFNNLPLSDVSNAGLATNIKVSGAYRVLGVLIDGDRCDFERCDEMPLECPVGNPDPILGGLYAARGRVGSVLRREGYVRVPAAVDLAVGDQLALVDDPAGDACLNLLGAVTLAGLGGQDLPASWVVESPAVAGSDVEIYIGG